MGSKLGDVRGNVARADAFIRRAAAKGAKFIVLPEAAIHGYLSQDLQQTRHVNGRPLSFKIHGESHEKMDAVGDLSQAARFRTIIRSDGTILAAAETQIGDEIVIADLDY